MNVCSDCIFSSLNECGLVFRGVIERDYADERIESRVDVCDYKEVISWRKVMAGIRNQYEYDNL